MPRLWLCTLAMLALSCGSVERLEQASSPTDPSARLGALEDRLLNAGTVRFDFHVTSAGAFEADLRGGLDVGPDERVGLTASGHFGGQTVDLLLRSEDDELTFGDRANPTSSASPPNLKEALLIGLTRMGILHNLALLTSARPPDHAGGGVREWVTVDSFAVGSADSLTFDITVAGQHAGSASLEIDARGLPIVRRQTVQFPSGEMRVVERYSAVTVEP